MKLERLRLKKDFQAVFQNGKKFFSPYAAALVLPNATGEVRVGIVVGTKVSKKAVTRNRIRRRVREALRTLLKATPQTRGMDIVVLPSITALDVPFEELKQELALIIKTDPNAPN